MADETIPHEDAVEGVIDQELRDLSTHAVIADLATNLAAASATYVQAEASAVRTSLNTTNTTVNAILAVLRDAGLIPTS